MRRDNENEPYRKIGENLKKLRSYTGLSQEEFGEILGVSFQQIQKYETGKNRLPALQLYMLQQIFNVPFEVFFENVQLGPQIPSLPPQEMLLNRVRSIRDSKTALRIMHILDICLDKAL